MNPEMTHRTLPDLEMSERLLGLKAGSSRVVLASRPAHQNYPSRI